jgi:hypothetical protein
MRVAVFSSKAYDRHSLGPIAAAAGHELVWLEPRLTPDTIALAAGYPAVKGTSPSMACSASICAAARLASLAPARSG